ncbi:BON domain-containing protein [Candidatus Gracilibacteria bacterium]|nr:BON domain-containing protein [Candidatus Gracilibacteria bacterium]
MVALVRAALRADSSTSEFAGRLRIAVRGSTVILRGEVDDLTDSDNASAVASYVAGVEEVIDKLRVRGL